MAETIGQHGIAAFTNPSNGDALDANIVKGNDNSLRSVYVDHDSDPGIHVQSSLLAARPAAGTAGRKWLTTDSGSVRLWFDDGSAWQEISYVSSAGTPTLAALNVTGDLTVDTTTLKVDSTNNRVGVGTATPGATLDVTGTLRTSNTLTITSGGASITGTVTATTFSGSLAASNLTGTSLPAGITGSSLTSVGTLTGLTMGGTTNMQDNILQRPRIQDYGEVRSTPTVSAGALTLNLNNGNVFNVSMSSSVTSLSITNPKASGTVCSFTLSLTYGANGLTVTWPASVRWPSGITPTLTGVSSKTDIFTFTTWDGGSTWYGFVAGQNF